MGKITGFLEYERENGKALPPKERIKNWNEFHIPLSEEEQKLQGAPQLHRRIPAQLVDRHRIGGTVQKTLLHIAGWDMALDRIPIRSCDAEHSVVLDDVLGFKDHFLGVVGIEHSRELQGAVCRQAVQLRHQRL